MIKIIKVKIEETLKSVPTLICIDYATGKLQNVQSEDINNLAFKSEEYVNKLLLELDKIEF